MLILKKCQKFHFGEGIDQGDLFHFLREVGRITQRLERRLGQVLKEETDA